MRVVPLAQSAPQLVPMIDIHLMVLFINKQVYHTRLIRVLKDINWCCSVDNELFLLSLFFDNQKNISTEHTCESIP